MKLGQMKKEGGLYFSQKSNHSHTLGNKYFSNAYQQTKRFIDTPSSANGIMNDSNSTLAIHEPIRNIHAFGKAGEKNMKSKYLGLEKKHK